MTDTEQAARPVTRPVPILADPVRVPCAVAEGVRGVFCTIACARLAHPSAMATMAACAFGAMCAQCHASIFSGPGKVVMVVPLDAEVRGRGWRASFVVEGERGHRPSGDWPFVPGPGATEPIFLGPSYVEASVAAMHWNSSRGVDPRAAMKVVLAAVFEGGR